MKLLHNYTIILTNNLKPKYCNFQIEGLIDEVDFKLHVTREEFEQLCSDLFERVQNPVEQALKLSGLTMDVISQVSSFC